MRVPAVLVAVPFLLLAGCGGAAKPDSAPSTPSASNVADSHSFAPTEALAVIANAAAVILFMIGFIRLLEKLMTDGANAFNIALFVTVPCICGAMIFFFARL